MIFNFLCFSIFISDWIMVDKDLVEYMEVVNEFFGIKFKVLWIVFVGYNVVVMNFKFRIINKF